MTSRSEAPVPCQSGERGIGTLQPPRVPSPRRVTLARRSRCSPAAVTQRNRRPSSVSKKMNACRASVNSRASRATGCSSAPRSKAGGTVVRCGSSRSRSRCRVSSSNCARWSTGATHWAISALVCALAWSNCAGFSAVHSNRPRVQPSRSRGVPSQERTRCSPGTCCQCASFAASDTVAGRPLSSAARAAPIWWIGRVRPRNGAVGPWLASTSR
jgi:hypothetical protein